MKNENRVRKDAIPDMTSDTIACRNCGHWHTSKECPVSTTFRHGWEKGLYQAKTDK